MSTQITTPEREQSSEKATPAQIAVFTAAAARLFKSTASAGIEIINFYPLLNAVNRNDVPTAQAEVANLIKKRQDAYTAYKAGKTTVAVVPSA